MTNLEALISDPYNRKARLQPALLALLPILVAIWLLVPEFHSSWGAVVGVVVSCGGAMWLMQIGRVRGKALEPKLRKAWDGMPSIAMLRHSDTRISKTTKGRYRAFLNEHVPNLKLPSPAEEKRSPLAADEKYESATAWLLAQTRDREHFRLILEENINYGFRRNFLALKPVALVADGLLIIYLLIRAEIYTMGSVASFLHSIDKATWFVALLTLVHFLGLVIWVHRNWVRAIADAYAKQLLAACDMLESSNH